MRIRKCYFCSANVYPGHGITFVRNDCKEFNFCRSKCHKAFKKRRNPRFVRWTKAFRKSHGKEMAVDPVYSFECVKNEGIKYDAKVWNETINAIKVLDAVKQRREKQFIHQRFTNLKERQMKAVSSDVETNKHILEIRNAKISGQKLKRKLLERISRRKQATRKVGKTTRNKTENMIEMQ